MTLGQQQELFSENICKLMMYAMSKGYRVRLGEGERTVEQQTIYVKAGRSKTMDSQHLKKLAHDIHFTKDGVLMYPDELGTYWESLDPGNSWGGFWKSFVDKPHFQYKP